LVRWLAGVDIVRMKDRKEEVMRTIFGLGRR
jgi:hypothetical protein